MSLIALHFSLFLCRTLIRFLLYSSSPLFLSSLLTPTLGLVRPFYLTSLQSSGFALHIFLPSALRCFFLLTLFSCAYTSLLSTAHVIHLEFLF